jgi:hypothetical protein
MIFVDRFKSKPHNRFLLIHISKTAGTSFRGMLESFFGSKNVYPGSFFLSRFPHPSYILGSELLVNYQILPKHNVLVGHFTAAIADMLPPDYKSVAFLRDPVERSLSTVAHFSKVYKTSPEMLLSDSNFISNRICNQQTRFLGADGICDLHLVGPADEDMLNRATKRLDEIDFIGITEFFIESCKRFDKQFCLNVTKHLRYENVLRPQGVELESFKDFIEPHVRFDRILYSCALEKFINNPFYSINESL